MKMNRTFETNVKLLSSFMRTTERAIVNKFAKLPRAEKLALPNLLSAVYIPGTRKDRVLLVAHYDTVWGDSKIKIDQWGTMLVSASAKVGIGADDRAGIAALWELRNTGHSLLILPEEETGCRGAQAAIQFHRDRFEKERFALQFDRRGSRDIVLYDCVNRKFELFMEQNMPGYSIAQGSISDISVLCPALGIAGANLSIGFSYEHTASEQLDVLDWWRTVANVQELLSKECPRYVYQKAKRYQFGGHTPARYNEDGRFWDYGPAGQPDDYHSWADNYDNYGFAPPDDDRNDQYYWCRDCASLFDVDEINDEEVCSSCGGPLSMDTYQSV